MSHEPAEEAHADEKNVDHAVGVTVEHLSLSLKSTKQEILSDVNITFSAGLTAIMGPTGSGKTCFLNAIAALVSPDYSMSGTIRINGKPYTSHQVHYGYVYQQDELSPNLTVWETLSFAAELQLAHLTEAQRNEQVTAILRELGLYYVKDTIVGNAMKKGISGGQRRRVSIALALLTDPTLLLLDEPTAGLDSVTALNLIETLKSLAERGCTIICVIHQPQRAIYELLDRLVLLRCGRIIYDGVASGTVSALEGMGYAYDGATNPADHIIEVISPRLGETMEELVARCKVQANYVAPPVDHTQFAAHDLPTPHVLPSFVHQLRILMRRQGVEEGRHIGLHVLSFFATAGCAALIGGVWNNVGLAQTSLRKRPPALFFCVINQSLFGAMKVIMAFPEQRLLMLRERRGKMYRAAPCTLAWLIVEMVFMLPWSFLFGIIAYFMIGLRHDAGKFFLFVFFMFLDKLCAASLAQMVSALTRTPQLATMLLPCGLEASRLLSGYFLSPKLMPKYMVWLHPLSYVKYAYTGVMLNDLEGLELHCPAVNGTTTCNPTLPRHGHDTILQQGLDYINIGGCIGALIAYVLFCRMVSYLALRLLKW